MNWCRGSRREERNLRVTLDVETGRMSRCDWGDGGATEKEQVGVR